MLDANLKKYIVDIKDNHDAILIKFFNKMIEINKRRCLYVDEFLILSPKSDIAYKISLSTISIMNRENELLMDMKLFYSNTESIDLLYVLCISYICAMTNMYYSPASKTFFNLYNDDVRLHIKIETIKIDPNIKYDLIV